jgi:hypothetical protein
MFSNSSAWQPRPVGLPPARSPRSRATTTTPLFEISSCIGLLNPREVRVLESAERVGNRPWALKQLALHRKRQTTRRISRWTDLALPLAVLLMGGFVLFQALGVFGPLISILQSLL